ncbi:cytochrome P450 [Microbacterium radiodurans]|uniref:Cytochrome P450 n=1 Tax=Microbacterium radiodurans TaxID=661398 RepID=A0A5J5IUX5_9MICO|nr:cytochrome P450 [Microbacterium radiodurans]KAA9089718.1 cytochrome P450 [Microbacterium radiodurans]
MTNETHDQPVREAPVADWVTIPDLYRDPFPIYDRLRAEGGVHWVPAVGRYLITSYAAVHETEFDQETFSANEEGSLQIRAMGHSMLRRDDPDHYPERKAWQPVLRPGVVKRTWTGVFERNARRFLDDMSEKGETADLIWDFAAPYAAENLREILGFHNASHEDLQRWSQTLIDATGNYADDPEVWERGARSFDEVDTALDEMLAWHRRHPDHSLISSLLAIPGEMMPIEKIRANVKMTIGGGLNEPRDALGVAAWALLDHPEQRRAVEADPSLWGTVFDETIRWIAPIGLYSRQTTRDVVLTGVRLPAHAKLGICILSANRDERVWPEADRFDIRREVKPHLAFSKGVHVCLGAWVARAEVADVGLPRLFERMRGLDLVPDRPAVIGGWVFRGMLALPARWDADAGSGSGADAATRVPGGAGSADDGTPAPRIAIVGSGPAGCFSAQALRRSFPAAEIDVVDALPTPFGLLRYGVAADHQGTKSVARQFERLFTADGVRFHGGVRLGGEVSLETLRASFDVVVLATGLRADASLGIPIDAAARVHGAGVMTRVLNGHPDETEVPELGREVVIVGHGNVALDVARLIVRAAEDFHGSDIDDEVRDRVAGRVRRVHLVGRSAPEGAKFDPVMVRELADIAGVEHVVHGADDLAAAGKDARADAVRLLRESSVRGDGEPRVRVDWWFGCAPVRVEAEALVVRDSAGDEHRIAADDVVSAIGFASDETVPVAAGEYPDGRVEPGLYVAGWLRRGPRGTIPDQRTDARTLARAVEEDIRAGVIGLGSSGWSPDTAVDFTGWRRIDLRERLGAAPGRERAKLRSREEMLAAARDEGLVPAPTASADEALTADVPVTILFGTESGGAELVAGELAAALGEDADVVVHDLADIRPRDLAPGRLHLVVCSTYGDGEVPTAARDFHRALVDGEAELTGIRYAVFGMGDRSYTRTYSRGSELVDEALARCGALRVGEYGRHDAGGETPATELACDWLRGVLEVAGRPLASPVA